MNNITVTLGGHRITVANRTINHLIICPPFGLRLLRKQKQGKALGLMKRTFTEGATEKEKCHSFRRKAWLSFRHTCYEKHLQ